MRSHHTNLSLPSFKRRTKIELAKDVVMILNAFSLESRISTTYSPHTTMWGKSLHWKKSCNIQFVAYAQVHEERNTTNALEERTQGDIYLGPASNLQGYYNFSFYALEIKPPAEN